jgi:enediyne polyketide synthase
LECFFPKQGDLAGVISESDVILATGGGKGITFESILALTTATQAKALIIGRSLPEQDTELANNLDRLRKSKITFRYYSADVSNAARVTEVVQNGIQELGPVTVCLHGAGYNKPKSLSQLTSDDFKNSLAIKLGGLQNVIASIDKTKLRLLLGYGSIIGESGMQGNADYAWANQKLARFIADFGVSNPQCRCIAFEWSVWDETGMGVSMNLLDNLKQRGVWPISISKGVDILKAIIADKECGNGNYIISGRYGSIPTLNYKRSRLPLGRFVSKIKHHIPGIEAVSDVSINLKDDVYLTNHVFQNQYVFPTVMILEGVAQVCNILSSKKSACTFEHLKINKSIFVSASAPNTIRFIVTRVDEHSFYAIVQSEDSNFETNCFEVTIKLDSEQQFTRQLPQALAFKQLEFDVDNKFYKDLLFHKGPFRRIKSFIKIQALESLAIAESSMLDEWFSSYMPNTYLLGDPGLNDAAIHCHQACRPGFSLLPTGAERIGINTTDIEGPFFIETIETHEEANNTFIDVYVYNKKGEVKIFWKNLVLTQVTGTSFKGDWDPHLLVPYIEYNVNKLSRTRNNKLPLESCFSLIESLRKQGSTEKYSIDGYTVSLKKQKHANSDAAVAKLQTGMAASSMFSSELQIVSLDEKVLLEICPR